MNSRERLLTALNHQEPDCVSYDLNSRQRTIHTVQTNGSPPNIIARWDARPEFGVY
ncbi:MAG: hypothetical protein H6631_05700 [Anaerolineaceae bacterium]|nr:hypothetical protein [Anaerolineaceae bacterium]MCB9102187.1 hypothetical protein [Anaerolineales bacterium]